MEKRDVSVILTRGEIINETKCLERWCNRLDRALRLWKYTHETKKDILISRVNIALGEMTDAADFLLSTEQTAPFSPQAALKFYNSAESLYKLLSEEEYLLLSGEPAWKMLREIKSYTGAALKGFFVFDALFARRRNSAA